MRSTYRDLMDIVSRRVLRAVRDVGCAGRGPKPGRQFAILLFFLAQPFVTLHARSLASPESVSLSLAWAAQDDPLQQGLAALKENHLDIALERLTAANVSPHSMPTFETSSGLCLRKWGEILRR
jgi:hypothetical protein